MITSPRIAPPPCPQSCHAVLVLLFGMTGKAVFRGVLLSPSMTVVGRGQDGPRRWLLAAWAFLTGPQTFLLSRRGLWAWYEIGRACQILQPHNIYYEFNYILYLNLWLESCHIIFYLINRINSFIYKHNNNKYIKIIIIINVGLRAQSVYWALGWAEN